VHKSVQFMMILRPGRRRRRPGSKIIINRVPQTPPESSPEPFENFHIIFWPFGTAELIYV
jgi:hypothetical protein